MQFMYKGDRSEKVSETDVNSYYREGWTDHPGDEPKKFPGPKPKVNKETK